MRISKIPKIDCMKTILFMYKVKSEIRFSELAKLFASRSAVSSCLRDLERNGIIQRRVDIAKKPVKVYYFLTEKGKNIGYHIEKIASILQEAKSV